MLKENKMEKLKIKILKSSSTQFWYTKDIGKELTVFYDIEHDVRRDYSLHTNSHYIVKADAVITELPKTFCVKKCGDKIMWEKYIKWLETKYNVYLTGNAYNYYGGKNDSYINHADKPFGTEIYIADIIKHIEYMQQEEGFVMTSDKDRLAYAKEHYPIGTRYIPLDGDGKPYSTSYFSQYEAKFWSGSSSSSSSSIEVGDGMLIYHDGKWAEIIKEVESKETNMETQKLSRKGLKEIHSVACPTWKKTLEQMGSRNPLEDYIEISQDDVDRMFKACTKEQLPIVSKYLKQDDGSVDLTEIKFSKSGAFLNSKYLIRQDEYERDKKSFWLNDDFNWEIKIVEGLSRLFPTRKK